MLYNHQTVEESEQNPDWLLYASAGQKAQKATKTIIADGPKNYRELLFKDQESQRKTNPEQRDKTK